ncbi:hypothetical protein BK139_02155 [Paenibacillus sp. FSL R5-0490]|uniref:hypothetical protein n=1 Tax=Paenibacillus sp. FSL R5-0490 TaxID=1920424 RepID=UPI00096EEC30|nr:hypothetical protein [Paenibacillus sp. FSL R5-0490]OMF62756.1 hypothetical protein BK139_02155 [Paenibacillus sp. FSL R5-0490]
MTFSHILQGNFSMKRDKLTHEMKVNITLYLFYPSAIKTAAGISAVWSGRNILLSEEGFN